jgi:hypothetical protein
MRRGLLVIACASLVPFLFACGGGSSGPPPVVITVSVSPASVNLTPNQAQSFIATVTGTTNMAVNWQVNGTAGGNATVGTINATGLYTAPATVPTPATVTVTAVSQADTSKSGPASVTISAVVNVVVSPSPASVEVFTTQQFNATVNGMATSAVSWQVNSATGGSASTGTISTSGLFTAPHSVPVMSVGGVSKATTVTVTAIPNANPSSSGSSVVAVTPPPGVQTQEATPVLLGTSGSNSNDSSTNGTTTTCCGGTLGSLVTRGGTQFILSNNHVLARSDLGVKTNGTTLGDPIIQPGLIDSRCSKNATTTVANLTDFFNLETGTGTKIDAAIAQVVPNMVDPNGTILELGATATNGVPDPGAPNAGPGVAAAVNMSVAKEGRSTGLTCSTVISTIVATTVSYQKGCGTGATFMASYTGQIMVAGGDFSAQGDSGSLIVTQNTADPVALLFAGSDQDTVGNPVSAVLNFFMSGTNAVTFVGGTAHQVIGCRGPFPLAGVTTVPNSLAGQVSTATTPQMLRATAVRDAHAPELLAHAEVQAVGVGASYDNAEEPAILFFVTRGAPRTNIPAQVDGIRTRIIEGDLFARRGSLSAADSAMLEQSAPAPQIVYSISDAEVARAKIVHAAHVDELMKQPGVQGVGISSSVDSPGEAALMIFLIRGEAHSPIPQVIDGLRTRVRVSSPFRAGFGDKQPPQRGCTVPATKKSQPSVTPNRRSH